MEKELTRFLVLVLAANRFLDLESYKNAAGVLENLYLSYCKKPEDPEEIKRLKGLCTDMKIPEKAQSAVERCAQNPQDQQRILEEAIWGERLEFNPPI